MMQTGRVIASSLAALAILACSSAAACDLEVESPWIREPAPGQTELAAYAGLKNTASSALRIANISAPGAASAMLHETRRVDGVSRMVMLDSLVIPARGRVALTPGGKHLMLSGVNRPVRAGERLPITFEDQSGCKTLADFVVRPLTATAD